MIDYTTLTDEQLSRAVLEARGYTVEFENRYSFKYREQRPAFWFLKDETDRRVFPHSYLTTELEAWQSVFVLTPEWTMKLLDELTPGIGLEMNYGTDGDISHCVSVDSFQGKYCQPFTVESTSRSHAFARAVCIAWLIQHEQGNLSKFSNSSI